MYRKEVEIKGGISSKKAQELVQHSLHYSSDVFLEQSTRRINAKSIMGVVSMGVKDGAHVLITANGDDEVEAVNDIANLLNS